MMQVPPGRSLLAGQSWPLWLAAAWIIGTVGALLSIWLGRRHSRQAKIVWTVIVFAPIIGPLCWLLLGRETGA